MKPGVTREQQTVSNHVIAHSRLLSLKARVDSRLTNSAIVPFSSAYLVYTCPRMSGVIISCTNLIKKPWAFIRVLYMSPTSYYFGVMGPGFLHQIPTLLLLVGLPLRLCCARAGSFG